MTDEPPRKRPILSLKNPPKKKAAPILRWKCKPCGGIVVITGKETEPEVIRCPACNARLGKAGAFLSDPPDLDHIRARRFTE
jgi:rubrerythrin